MRIIGSMREAAGPFHDFPSALESTPTHCTHISRGCTSVCVYRLHCALLEIITYCVANATCIPATESHTVAG